MANAFGLAGGQMKQTGVYEGVLLDGIDPVKIAEGFGVEAMDVQEESKIGDRYRSRPEGDRERRPAIPAQRSRSGRTSPGRQGLKALQTCVIRDCYSSF